MATAPQPVDGFSEEQTKAFRKAQETIRNGGSLRLLQGMTIKRALKEALPPESAFRRYKQAFAPGPDVHLRRQPAVSQLTAAEAGALVKHVVHSGGETVEMRPSHAIGEPSEMRTIRGASRRVFVACLPNATAFARSSTVRLADGTFAFDIQPGELGKLPVDLSFDPVVFDHDGDKVAVIDDQRETTLLHLPEALSLMGMNTVSFGHWMVEEFLKFLTARRFPEVALLPILIDAGMPRQHRESLMAFTGDSHPIIAVPRHMRVEVERLWIVSSWFYIPGMLKSIKNIDLSFLACSAAEIAAIYREAWEMLVARLPAPHSGSRVFIFRDPAGRRAITNHAEVEQILRCHGFELVRPEQLSFIGQLQTYFGASHVAIQAGSAEAGLLMCVPGARACVMTHPATPFRALVAQIARELGIQETLLVGEIASPNKDFPDWSSYRINPIILDSFLSEMLDKGAND
jgi:capsular polysaccharide biosynthesis protein